jgi:aminoglycoside/choline kinase family phosphotransferase/GTP:adenosylcobinamide-phosphate guanylyltransferase
MKAMILAAGFGTRLLPFTLHTPKALFTIGGRPVLDLTIRQLQRAGCQAIVVNTHHLPDQIESYLAKQTYRIPVTVRHEPQILGTGGAVRNVADFWDEKAFIVINADIVSDIDLHYVYRFHSSHPHPVSLVLCRHPDFDTVAVDGQGFVVGFSENPSDPPAPGHRLLTFTGIQVLDPTVLEHIPPSGFYSIIDAYRSIIANGGRIATFRVQGSRWQDIGTPEAYRRVAIEQMAQQAFDQFRPGEPQRPIAISLLAGDGSDRRWFRLTSGRYSMVMADHGIRNQAGTTEADAFVAIGRHLKQAGVAVPEIFLSDTFCGLVFLEDLGDTHLQQVVRQAKTTGEVFDWYRFVIRQLIAMSLNGAKHFDPAWTCQTPNYSREVILEKECRYFVEAFLQTYCGQSTRPGDLADEFSLLADRALADALPGFMHRDCQSRNIMVRAGATYFIDFQGGRLGPLQYDLASLLIDPYVDLPPGLRSALFDFAVDCICRQSHIDPQRFRSGYETCCLTRNLQILGAFGHLSRNKGKKGFEPYIPAAVRSLKHALSTPGSEAFPKLKRIVDAL